MKNKLLVKKTFLSSVVLCVMVFLIELILKYSGALSFFGINDPVWPNIIIGCILGAVIYFFLIIFLVKWKIKKQRESERGKQ